MIVIMDSVLSLAIFICLAKINLCNQKIETNETMKINTATWNKIIYFEKGYIDFVKPEFDQNVR